MRPTPEQLKQEIETGPLAPLVEDYWARFFEPPSPDPPQPDRVNATSDFEHNEALGRWRETVRSNAVKRDRHNARALHPDAVVDLQTLMYPRFSDLDWEVDSALVEAARRL